MPWGRDPITGGPFTFSPGGPASPPAEGGGSSIPWGTILGVGTTLAAGAIGYAGTSATNSSNLRIAREQMAFQKEMSDTAHQRAMKDLEKAGLNPILAAGGPGASTPSGAGAVMSSAAKEGVASAMAARRFRAELELLEEQQKKIREERHGVQADNDMKEMLNTDYDYTREWRLGLQRLGFLREAANEPYFAKTAEASYSKLVNDARAALEHGEYFKASRILQELDQPRGQAEANFYRGVGKYMPAVKGAGEAAHSALGVKWLLKSLLPTRN